MASFFIDIEILNLKKIIVKDDFVLIFIKADTLSVIDAAFNFMFISLAL